MSQPKLLHQRLNLQPGNIILTDVQTESWGARLIVELIYRHPPQEVPVRLVFDDVRRLDWYVQKTSLEMARYEHAQLMTHDLGQEDYQRTARLATNLAEIIISYHKLKIIRES